MNDKLITKSQLAWLVIRLLGLYFIFGSVLTFIALAGAAIAAPRGGAPALGTLLLMGICQFFIGLYLLREGSYVHRLLLYCTPLSADAQKAQSRLKHFVSGGGDVVDPETTLSTRETIDLIEWLDKNPEYKARPYVDQIALFRDFQNKTIREEESPSSD